MTAQQLSDQTKDDERILFDNVLVPNIDNELVFDFGDDSYMSSMDWDGANIAFASDNNANNNDSNADNVVVDDPDQEELQNLLLDLNDDDFPSPSFSSNTTDACNITNNKFPSSVCPPRAMSSETKIKSSSRQELSHTWKEWHANEAHRMIM